MFVVYCTLLFSPSNVDNHFEALTYFNLAKSVILVQVMQVYGSNLYSFVL